MSESAYGTPLLIKEGGEPLPLSRVPLGKSGKESGYDEEFVQKLAFDHPETLPIAEIDRAYEGLVPVCLELSMPAGALDALYVTPRGRLVIAESKLWRNPEARRKVVSQILDYAKDFAQWDYEDLQRAVSSKLKRKGNVLFDLVKEKYPDTDEAQFVDEVQKSLKHGRFLLLIIGDGIREGAGAIAEFLSDVGNLEFTFGLVELALYRGPTGARLLVQPRVIARTVIVNRTVIALGDGMHIVEEENEPEKGEKELSETQRFYLDFWKEFTSNLVLDDPGQSIPNTTRGANLFFALPPSGGTTWVSAYVSKYRNTVGVYITFLKGSFGDMAYERLLADREAIDDAISPEVQWQTDGEHHKIIVRHAFDDVWSDACRKDVHGFFGDMVNRFVNAFRPRLEQIVAEMKE